MVERFDFFYLVLYLLFPVCFAETARFYRSDSYWRGEHCSYEMSDDQQGGRELSQVLEMFSL